MCVKSTNFYLVNTKTGKEIPLDCRTYSCPDCGPIKVWRLRKYLTKYFETWGHIRFWTFTLQYPPDMSEEKHQKLLALAWHKFITYVRRTKSLSKYQSKFSYVKVYEPHKRGNWHLHVLINRYLSYDVLQPIWESCCMQVLEREVHSGQCWVVGKRNPRQSANYVCKYITKTIKTVFRNLRRYSTSHGIRLFPSKKSSGDWIIVNLNLGLINSVLDQLSEAPPLLVSIVHNCTGIPPPKTPILELFEDFRKTLKIDSSEKAFSE